MSLNVEQIRAQFPILQRRIDGNPLIYLDNAATTQKPQAVIDAISHYYTHSNSNVHRGAHTLADEATKLFEGARDTVAQFIGAATREEVIWTSGTTEAINIVAHGMTHKLRAGDKVLVTEMEHHANLVTWQQACLNSGAELIVSPILDTGELDVEAFTANLSNDVKLIAMPHISNALGTVNPLETLIPLARSKTDALVMIDGAQGIAHGGVKVGQLDCDFYTFSAHKVFGPTGMGVLWGKKSVLEDWPVWLTGGEMISTVTYQQATWGDLPNRLEAGTPHIAGAVGLAAAINWLAELDLAAVQSHERLLMETATELAQAFDGLKIIGTAPNKIGVLSFVMDCGHPADIGFLLDKQGIAIRTGDHCAQPLMNRLAVPGTARASFSIYNTVEEIESLFSALRKVQMMLA